MEIPTSNTGRPQESGLIFQNFFVPAARHALLWNSLVKRFLIELFYIQQLRIAV